MRASLSAEAVVAIDLRIGRCILRVGLGGWVGAAMAVSACGFDRVKVGNGKIIPAVNGRVRRLERKAQR